LPCLLVLLLPSILCMHLLLLAHCITSLAMRILQLLHTCFHCLT
jgi:hypothetical protein